MLTDEQAAILVQFLKDVRFTDEQQDRLIEKYWEANDKERTEISRAYSFLFSKKQFIERLLKSFDIRQLQAEQQIAASSASNDSVSEGSTIGCSGNATESPLSPSSLSYPSSASGASSGRVGSRSNRQLHAKILLRTAIEDQFPKLTGSGPFPISFCLVRTEAERKEVADLFASQFEYPDPPEILRLVSLPQALNTRTRRRTNGSYTWYIRSLTTRDVVCAVNVIAHHHFTHHFVEMPLFATAGGYKNNGFGRLLNAALCAWCAAASFEFIMVSADTKAIPFWKHLEYKMMSLKERKSIDFYYMHECYKFKGAEPMIGYCRDVNPGCPVVSNLPYAAQVAQEKLENVLKRMTKFVVVGPVGFEE